MSEEIASVNDDAQTELTKVEVPKGRPVELPETPIMPNNNGQLFIKLSSAADIRGILVAEPGIIVRVIAGPYNFPTKESEAAGRDWTDIIGKRVTEGAFVTVIVRNPSGEVKAIGGALYVENEERPPAKSSQVQGAGPGSGARRVSHSYPQQQQQRPTSVQKVLKGGPVIPGTNEVAILMKHGNATRLLAMVKAGSPLHDSEKPQIIRDLERALGK